MITNSLLIDSLYSVKLTKTFGSGEYNIRVIGTTTIDAIEANQEDFNVYETYFKPLNIGLTTYYTAINPETTIYICNLITSLEPLEIDTDEKIFIPDSLIDKEISDMLIPASLYNFNITGIYKRYTTDLDRDNLAKLLVDQIYNGIKTYPNMSNVQTESNDIKQINELVYVSETFMNEYEQKVIDKNNYNVYLRSAEREKERLRKISYDTQMKLVTQERSDLAAKINEYDELNKELSRLINEQIASDDEPSTISDEDNTIIEDVTE